MTPDLSQDIDSKYPDSPDFLDVGTLSIALIGPNASLRKAVARSLSDCHAGGEVREYSSYPPSLDDVPRLLEAEYNVIIIDMESDRDYALELVEAVCANGIATVMVYTAHEDPELILQCMRSGVRDILTQPFTQSTVAAALIRAAARRPAVPAKKLAGRMLVFLGSKGGAGVTTIATNFAVALAQEPSQRTLLIDLDLPLGDAALNLGLEAEFSTVNALQEADHLDRGSLFRLLVEHDSGLKVLAAPGEFPQFQSSKEAIEKLLTVARQNFDNVVVDVGSEFDLAGTALLRDATTFYLITQASVPELRNSHRLITEYFSSGVPAMEVVINRHQTHALGVSDEHITKALTRPIQWKIPNDYAAVRQMQSTATPIVHGDSSLSQRIREMASVITGQTVTPAKKKSFSFKSLSRIESAKNGSAEEDGSVSRPTPFLISATTPSSSLKPDVELRTPEPFVYSAPPNPPSRTLIPFEPSTLYNEAPIVEEAADDAEIEKIKGEILQTSYAQNQNEDNGPETRVYKGLTYIKGPDGRWHLKPEEGEDLPAAEETLEPVQESPEVLWQTPAPISYGTPLGGIQLNATSPVPGSFEYAPAKGYVLPTGTHTIWVTFIPTDRDRYARVQASVPVTVTMATPIVRWPTPAAVTYGTPLGESQLNAASVVPGIFTYSPGLGEILRPGIHTLSVLFTPSDTKKYTTKQTTVTINVRRGTPVITWRTPDPIAYGVALSARELNATASVAGNFAYTPGIGAVLSAGTHTPMVVFTPEEIENYTTAQAAVALTVTKGKPIIRWTPPAPIAYGTALSETELSATATVAGTFTYSPDRGEILKAGVQTLSVTFIPADSVDYSRAESTVQLTVTKGAPTRITWPEPAEITYGTALSGIQLNATASEPGAFEYRPSDGEYLTPGKHTLSVTFTPTDPNFPVAEGSVSIAVRKATPTITWPAPSPIPCGTALGSAELNATASVPGRFTYTPPTGDIPGAGIRVLSVTFTPEEEANYTTAEASVRLTVTRAKPVINWSDPAPISYGMALSDNEFNATASVPGTFVFTPAIGTVLTAGTQTLEATFTPEDTANYDTAQASVQLVVTGLAQFETLAHGPIEVDRVERVDRDDRDDISHILQANRGVGGQLRRIQGNSPLEGAGPMGVPSRFGGHESSQRIERPDANSDVLQTGTNTDRSGEQETRSYKGATYVKGADGKWHIKQN
ncbi:MAG: AAA family ATPase [Terracidiphilus sp.]